MNLNHKRIVNMGIKKRITLIFLLPMLISLIFLEVSAQEDKKISWTKDQTTIDAAKLQGKPGMLYFYSGNRTTSSTDVGEKVKDSLILGLFQETLNNRDVVALSRKFSCFEFNIFSSPRVVTRYDVTIYPVLIFTDPWGNEISRCLGKVSYETLFPLMEMFPEDYSDVLNWAEILDEERENFEALKGMGEFYLNLEAWRISNQFYDRAFETKFVRENEDAYENIILVIGLNELRMRNYEQAQKKFETCLDIITSGKDRDKTLLGLIIAQLGQNNILGAERNLKELKSQFPDSPAIKQAERYIQSVKELK